MNAIPGPRVTASSQCARHEHAVCFCSDEGYLPFALFAALQIHRLHPDRCFDLVIAHTGPLSVPHGFPGIGIRYVEIDTGGCFERLALDARRTGSTYLRLALSGALGHDYQRILYMDSDVFALRDGLHVLLFTDMRGKPLAAVRDNSQWRTSGRKPDDLVTLNLPARPYFNAGVLLMDTARLNEQDILAKALDLGTSQAGRLARHDQTLLNAVTSGNWAEMSPRWNWQFTWASWIFALSEDARILHFIGPNKPWADTSGRFPKSITRAYGDFLAEQFPERTVERAANSPINDPRRLIKSLIKHGLSRKKMSAYLARFADDFTLIDPS
ncbi:glycosyltransferase family 8 protein [Dinoroseobacter shibae]|nr:glycosyltransferase family 8 protein [Dinoroseobacter shibae]URF46573.1 glycosyltransferase family 8 protein [Dinoroseobacter shibae]URF50879.1 glycosyltransferase family 8 protein [Dinoroseobacter shibae]